jgi:hypothetical protein
MKIDGRRMEVENMSSTTNIVTQHLIQTVRKQLQQYHVVVWFDPEKQYPQAAQAENFPGVHTYFYDPEQGFMALRRELEVVWGTVDPPQLLIYVPIAEADSHHALVEYTTAGVTLQPGQQPVERNTRLAMVARQALNGILPANKLVKVLSEVENGMISLAELDEVASRHKEIHIGALSLIFKTENTEEICLQFLTSDQYDTDIKTKDASATLINLLKDEIELQLSGDTDLIAIRRCLARHLLLAEFMDNLGKSIPTTLSSIKVPKTQTTRETILRLVREWRLRNDFNASYLEAAQSIEADLSLEKHSWTLETLKHVETFAGIQNWLKLLKTGRMVSGPIKSPP